MPGRTALSSQELGSTCGILTILITNIVTPNHTHTHNTCIYIYIYIHTNMSIIIIATQILLNILMITTTALTIASGLQCLRQVCDLLRLSAHPPPTQSSTLQRQNLPNIGWLHLSDTTCQILLVRFPRRESSNTAN